MPMRYAMKWLPALAISALLGAGCASGPTPASTAPPSGTQAPQTDTSSIPTPARTTNGFVGSCDVRNMLGMCYEYSGSWWDADRAKGDCDSAPGGVFSATDHCPTASRVATCPYNPQEGKTSYDGTLTYVFYTPATLEQANKSCPNGNVTPATP